MKGSFKKANCDNCGAWCEYTAVWNESHTTFRALCDLCRDLERRCADLAARDAKRKEEAPLPTTTAEFTSQVLDILNRR